jgi:transcriptional regulator with XRE-family HTH domain
MRGTSKARRRRHLKPVPPSWGEALRAWRIAEGISQTEAGARVGVSQVTWSDWENENKEPRIQYALRIVKVTGLPLELLARPLPAAANGDGWPAMLLALLSALAFVSGLFAGCAIERRSARSKLVRRAVERMRAERDALLQFLERAKKMEGR